LSANRKLAINGLGGDQPTISSKPDFLGVKAPFDDHSTLADLNEAAMRRTHSRVAEPTVDVI